MKLEITKDNYKKYIEYLKLEKEQRSNINKLNIDVFYETMFDLVVISSSIIMFIISRIPTLSTLFLCITFPILLLPVVNITQLCKAKKNYKKLQKEYLNDQDWNINDVKKALEEAHILKYNPHTDLEFYDEKGFEDYCNCEQVKKEISNEPYKAFRYPERSISESELQKVKVKKLTRK